MNVAVLMTCHNRREKTLTCLRALFGCWLPEDMQLTVFLVDDGSTDGTGYAVKIRYPMVQILQGSGSLYWNGGMRMAFASAMERGFDYYLWLNDDTYLYPQTLSTLIRIESELRSSKGKATIVVGSTQAHEGGTVNHGGFRYRGKRLWTSKLIEPTEFAVTCDSLNGNCVLIPHQIASRIGNLDDRFIHTIGDIDYGLRAKAAGFGLVVMPGFAGTCQVNPIRGTFNDPSLSLRERYIRLFGPKGLPPKHWLVFQWRHFGWMGLLYWTWTYVKVLITWVRARSIGI